MREAVVSAVASASAVLIFGSLLRHHGRRKGPVDDGGIALREALSGRPFDADLAAGSIRTGRRASETPLPPLSAAVDPLLTGATLLLMGLIALSIAQSNPLMGLLALGALMLLYAISKKTREATAKAASLTVGALTAAVAPEMAVDLNLNGTWLKNAARSDSMDQACDAMQLNGIIRTAVRLVRGMELRVDSLTFELGMFSVVPWFKVRERYALSGDTSMWSRRDLRRGKHRGHLRVESHGGVTIAVAWDMPLAGHGTDEFVLVGPDELHVHSTLFLSGTTVQYTVVYDRKK